MPATQPVEQLGQKWRQSLGTDMDSSQTLPRFIGPLIRLPALFLLLGHRLAREASGRRSDMLISAPISARIAAKATAPIPGMVFSSYSDDATSAALDSRRVWHHCG